MCEWQQVTSSLQDSSKYPDYSSSVVWMVSIFPHIFSSSSLFSRCYRSKRTKYNLYNRHLSILQLFHFSDKIQVFVFFFFVVFFFLFFFFFFFLLWNGKIHLITSSFFILLIDISDWKPYNCSNYLKPYNCV